MLPLGRSRHLVNGSGGGREAEPGCHKPLKGSNCADQGSVAMPFGEMEILSPPVTCISGGYPGPVAVQQGFSVNPKIQSVDALVLWFQHTTPSSGRVARRCCCECSTWTIIL
jgi:hypothetical protein